MKKLAKGAWAAAALAVATAMVTSCCTGAIIQEQVEASIQRWSYADGVNIRLLSYERGVVQSQAHTLWSLAYEDEAYDFTVSHHIIHGPWAQGQAAQITSTLSLPTDSDPALIHALHDQAPLQWTATTQWSGDTRHQVISPHFSSLFEDGSSLTWGGMTAQWQFNAQSNAVQGFAQMPALHVNAPDRHRLSLEDLEWSFDAHIPAGLSFWTGTTSLQVGLLALQDMETATQLEIQQLRLAAFSGLEAQGLHMHLQASIAHIVAQAYALDTLAFDADLRNLNPAWLDALLAPQAAGATDATALLSMVDSLPLFLASQPELSLTQLRMHTPEGNVSMSARAHYQGLADEAVHPWMDLQAQLHAQIPQAIWVEILNTKVRSEYIALLEQLEQTLEEPQLRQAVEDGVSKRIQALLEQDAIRTSGDAFTTELELKQGEITLNGKPRALEELLHMGEAI